MFGANKVYGVVSVAAPLWVQAVFPTIQGEGPHAGVPATFIRLGGCNLRCHFCDTDFESVREMLTTEQLVARVIDAEHAVPGSHDQGPLAVITGGEPMRQYIAPLVKQLLALGWQVQIETAGTVWPHGLEDIVMRHNFSLVCSPKTGTVHRLIEEHCRHWKYIVRYGEQDDEDGLPCFSTQEKGRRLRLWRPSRKSDTIWLQPCEEYRGQRVDKIMSKRNAQLAGVLAMRHGYRLSLQIHKMIGLP
jgi:7-carboxy-7-deazaguanine synthase